MKNLHAVAKDFSGNSADIQNYHEKITEQKQKLIIIDEKEQIDNLQINVFSQPLEILSGDIYGVIKTCNGALFYIVDCMGKGVSAAITAVLCGAFINRSVKLSTQKQDFDFERTSHNFTDYIGSYLMDDESLSFLMGHLDTKTGELEYVNCGMYPMLLKENGSGEVQFLSANYAPLIKGEVCEHSKSVTIEGDFTLLAYSDGVCELGDMSYKELAELFKYSLDFDTFLNAFGQFVSINDIKADDDITTIFLKNKK